MLLLLPLWGKIILGTGLSVAGLAILLIGGLIHQFNKGYEQ